MRLQELCALCREAVSDWVEPAFEEVVRQPPSKVASYRLTNPDEVFSMLERLREAELFAEQCTAIYDILPGKWVAEISSSDRTAILRNWHLLQMRSETVCDIGDFLNVPATEAGFDVKLPPNMTLPELSRCAHDLNEILTTCPMLQAENDTIKFAATDVGSIWLTFLVIGGSILVLERLAVLVDQAVRIRSHMITCRQQEEAARAIGLKNDLLDAVVEANKEIIKKATEQVTQELSQKYEIDTPEDQGRLNNSLKTLAEWMNKGMEIYASIEAPPEVKQVFPPLEKQALPDELLKLLTEHVENIE